VGGSPRRRSPRVQSELAPDATHRRPQHDHLQAVQNCALHDLQQFVVDDIVGWGFADAGHVVMKVHWRGFDDTDDTWEPMSALFADIEVIVTKYVLAQDDAELGAALEKIKAAPATGGKTAAARRRAAAATRAAAAAKRAAAAATRANDATTQRAAAPRATATTRDTTRDHATQPAAAASPPAAAAALPAAAAADTRRRARQDAAAAAADTRRRARKDARSAAAADKRRAAADKRRRKDSDRTLRARRRGE